MPTKTDKALISEVTQAVNKPVLTKSAKKALEELSKRHSKADFAQIAWKIIQKSIPKPIPAKRKPKLDFSQTAFQAVQKLTDGK